ncbi:MAG TPA: adenylate kinase [Thermoplasmata archaeon]|nr:adenylate kinase [Thermoplasmata archaeon]
MRLVLLGPPGSGKGTQGAKLAEALGVPRISTGDILRRNVAAGTELGRKAKAFMESGKLVPDELVIAMTAERLREPDAQKGFILDGFPRTIAQAEALSKLTPLDAVVNLFLEPEELVKRSAGRRVCPKCEAVYHLVSNPPRKAGVCDRCGTALVTRPDDREEVVRTRIETYERQAAPLIQYFKDRRLLREVYASGLIDEISLRVQEVLRA